MTLYYQVTVFYESASHPGAEIHERQPSHRDQETFDEPEDILPWLSKHLPIKTATLKHGGREAVRFRHGEEVEGRTFGYWCRPDRSGNRWYEWATVVVEEIENAATSYSQVVA